MRKLATYQRVAELRDIPGADRIVLARMDGNAWRCVVGKEDFKVGDMGVYFEIDSLLPVVPAFAFLAKQGTRTSADGSIGYRLRSINLKGRLSQGLLMPLHKLGMPAGAEGAEVTGELGVKLFEAVVPACIGGDARRMLPGFIRRTDQERVQNLPDVVERYGDRTFEVTEKVDGTSTTFYECDGDFGVCSHGVDLKPLKGNSLWAMNEKYSIRERMMASGRSMFAIQGETAGPGIQSNRYKLSSLRMFVFDIWDIAAQRYLTSAERTGLVAKMNSADVPGEPLEMCHVIDPAKRLGDFKSIEEILAYADGDCSTAPGHLREGVVFKMNTLDEGGHTFSFKAVSNKYLLGE